MISRRGMDLPITFQSFGSRSFTSFEGSSFDASCASSPYVSVLSLQRTTLFAATPAAAGTCHRDRAAVTSISRAWAPDLRRYSCEVRMPELPVVDIEPQMRFLFTCSLGEANSHDVFAGSHSSSSETSCTSPVSEP